MPSSDSQMCPACGGKLTVRRHINWFGISLAILLPPIGVWILAAQGLTTKELRCVRCPWTTGP
jgi:ribosomal protein S27AE